MDCLFRISGVILLFLLFHSCKKEDDTTIRDGDRNVYTSVQIGTQVWLVENLKTTKFNDGTSIGNVTDNTEWASLTSSAYCWYNNDASTNKNPYGALYNWYTLTIGKLCPSGWHVPTDTEWTDLFTYLGGGIIAMGKLKETGTTHWLSPNTGATNETGFTALPGGYRGINGNFGSVDGYGNIGSIGGWWSSTHTNDNRFAWVHAITYDEAYDVSRYDNMMICGFSIRCVKDN